MYLSGLGDCAAAYTYTYNDSYVNDQQCISQGGSPSSWNGIKKQCNIPPKCSSPAPQQSAPITVTVPTNVNTTVSPQISPTFVQQDHPNNSPVDTKNTQTPTDATYLALLEALAKSGSGSSAPQPVYSYDAPAPAPAPKATVSVQPSQPNYAMMLALVLGGAGVFYVASNMTKKRK